VLLIILIFSLLLLGCHQVMRNQMIQDMIIFSPKHQIKIGHSNQCLKQILLQDINQDNNQLDYLLEDQINLNHQIQDLIHKAIMFTLVIMMDLSNQIQHTKMRVIKQESHPQGFLQVEVINQNLLTVVLILKLDMCILEIMISHSNQTLITKLITTTNHDNLQLDFHQEDRIKMNQMIKDSILKQDMFTLETMIDLFNLILIIKGLINQNIEIHNHKDKRDEWLTIVLHLIIRRLMQ
jgi:hypothetical protein